MDAFSPHQAVSQGPEKNIRLRLITTVCHEVSEMLERSSRVQRCRCVAERSNGLYEEIRQVAMGTTKTTVWRATNSMLEWKQRNKTATCFRDIKCLRLKLGNF